MSLARSLSRQLAVPLNGGHASRWRWGSGSVTWGYSPGSAYERIEFFDPTNSLSDAFNSGFAYYGEFDITTAGTKELLHADVDGGAVLRISSSGVFQISNWAAFTNGSNTYTAGRYAVAVRYDGSVVDVWIKPDGGNVVHEINSQSTSFTATRNDTGVAIGAGGTWGSFFAGGNMSKISAGALWVGGNYFSEAEAVDLLNKTIIPADVTPAPYINLAVDEHQVTDIAGNITPLRVAGEPETMTLDGVSQVIYPMRHPETGEPVQYDAGSGAVYWGAYNSEDASSNVEFRLATSSDLDTWTDYGLIENFGNADPHWANEFIYVGDIAGAHDPFMFWYVAYPAGLGSIYCKTSADMDTWSDDAANPVFVNAAGPGNGVEDFRICKIGANDWAAYYEQDGYETDDARAVGVCQNTNTVPSGSWTNVDDDILGSNDTIIGANPFHANPGVIRRGNEIYLFYEVVEFGVQKFGPAEFLRVAPLSGAYTRGAFVKRGCVMHRDYGKAMLFGNPTWYENGNIYRHALTSATQTNPSDSFKIPIRSAAFEQVTS